MLREGGGKAGHERQRKMGRLSGTRAASSFARQGLAVFRDRALGRVQNVRAMGENSRGGGRDRHRQRRGRSVHDRGQ